MQTDVRIETPRLLLRTLREDDVPLVLTWGKDPEVVRNFSFFATEPDPERVRRYIAEKRASETDLLLAVFEKEPDGYVGNVGLHELDRANDNARLGIILRREAWGRGLAGEALSGLMRYGFSSMGLFKIYLNVFSTNEKGLHLYGKLGFVREGTLRAEYKLRGQYQDLVRMSVLATEWPTAAAREALGPSAWGSP